MGRRQADPDDRGRDQQEQLHTEECMHGLPDHLHCRVFVTRTGAGFA